MLLVTGVILFFWKMLSLDRILFSLLFFYEVCWNFKVCFLRKPWDSRKCRDLGTFKNRLQNLSSPLFMASGKPFLTPFQLQLHICEMWLLTPNSQISDDCMLDICMYYFFHVSMQLLQSLPFNSTATSLDQATVTFKLSLFNALSA